MPGADILGQSYNPFAQTTDYVDPNALRGAVFELNGGAYQDVPFSYPPGQAPATPMRGLVPDGVDVQESDGNTVNSTVAICNSSYDFSLQVGESLGVSGQYGMFRGSVQVQTMSSKCESSSYYYCMMYGKAIQYSLALDSDLLDSSGESGSSILSSAFQANVGSLPPSFDPASNVEVFRGFFRTYGTHVITKVGMGCMGRLVVSVQRKSQSNTFNATANVQAEYEGVASGRSQSSIKYTSSSWVSDTERTFSAIGGDPDLGLDLENDPFGQTYARWKSSVAPTNLSAVSITLVALWDLAPLQSVYAPQVAALQAAYAYLTVQAQAIPVYQYTASDEHDYMLTAFEDSSLAPGAVAQDNPPKGHTMQGIVWYSLPQAVYVPQSAVMQQFLRFYNGKSFMYTSNPADEALEGYKPQPSKFLVVLTDTTVADGAVPLYRYCATTGAHLFTTNQADAPLPTKEGAARYEGIPCAVFGQLVTDPFSQLDLLK
jgi:hypothetical protein